MSPDPFEALHAELVRAAARPAGRRLSRRRRAAALGLTALAVGGTATAAVVTQGAETPAPLGGRLPASVRGYAISVSPDTRAGAVGWCAITRFTTRGHPSGVGTGCGGAAGAGLPVVSASVGELGGGILRQVIVTRRVALVVFPGNRRVATRADRRLPFGWRAAVLYEPGARFEPTQAGLATTYEDAAGRVVLNGFSPSRFARGTRSQVAVARRPATGCAIDVPSGYRVVEARVAVGAPDVPRLESPAFFSCARTVLRRGKQGMRLDAAILQGAENPDARAAPLPPTPGLSGRRLGPGWLVVSGGTAVERRALLGRLDASR